MPQFTPTTSNESSSSSSLEDSATTGPAKQARDSFPWRAFLIGILIVPVCVYWIEYTEIVTRAADLAAMSLIISVVAFLLGLILINQIVRRFARKYALTQSELLLIYAINATSVGICGIGSMQFLVTELPAQSYFSTASDHWESWRHYLRPWAFPASGAIPDFYKGRSSLFVGGHLQAWMAPILVWSVFLFALMFTFYCIATLLRRQWVERERLLFPIVIIPLEITQNGGAAPIFRSRLFWLGFVAAVFLELLATLHYTVSPGIPYVPIKPDEQLYNIGQYITAVPWNGIGTLELAIYPMVIGLAYLLSLDVSFSVWFFYWLNKLESIAAVALGFKDPGAPLSVSRIPFTGQQCAGAFTGLAIISLYFALPHLKQALRHAFRSSKKPVADGYSDEHEPMSYRAAFVGVVGGTLFLIAFVTALGMSLLVGTLFVVLFLLWAITMTRIRAEAGLPWGGGPSDNVHGNMVDTAGVQNFNSQEMVALATMRWIDSDWRTIVMPQQLEVMKIADDGMTGTRLINARHMTVCIFVAVAVAIGASWFSLLTIYYRHGASSADVEGWRTITGQWTFDQVNTWLQNPLPFDSDAMKWTVGGAIFTVFLSIMRARFVWWPFHPIGYAASLTGLDWIWCPIFIGWAIKRLILRYGGLSVYRQALPFFIGLVIGDYAISSIFALLYSILGQSGYRTFPV